MKRGGGKGLAMLKGGGHNKGVVCMWYLEVLAILKVGGGAHKVSTRGGGMKSLTLS